MNKVAIVVGVSGITGSNLAEELIKQGWTTYGLARNPHINLKGLQPVAADLLRPDNLATALADVAPTHVFFTSWMRMETEAENIRVNGTMVRNLLNALAPKKSVQHVALVTGLKHYLGPFEAYAKEDFFLKRPCARSSPGWRLKTSIMHRRMRYMPLQSGMALPGACIARIRLLARQLATK